jgi:DNA-binding MarR family transcriptional regulator
MSELTERGRITVEAGTTAANSVEAEMLSEMSADEVDVLNDLLKRCAMALQRDMPDK